jgi:predicted nucleotidyltransferase
MISIKQIFNTGLTDEDTAIIYNIFNKYPSIKEVKIFGSRANKKYKVGSDIDLVILNNDFGSADIALIKSDFEESSLPYFVDLIEYKTIKNQNLKEHINNVGIAFYSI